MYYKVKDGSSEIIKEYECQLPPVGYGKNRLTGKIEHIGVVKRSIKKEEQYWQRVELPIDWDKKCKVEALGQKDDDEYFDPELEKTRNKHWQYRLCGMWFMINGKEVYITGSYYFYLNYCQLDIGYPAYRDTDRQFFYVWEFCVEDPRCAGLCNIERRRTGKTFKSGSIILDRTSMLKNHHAGIQSKTSSDSKQVFLKAVVTFFKKIPNFFRPVFDQSKGVTPTSELRFFQTVVKGKKAEQILDQPELESWVDHGSSDIYHYDGSKLNTYVMDEFGKTVECSVWDRWNVVRFCLDQDGEWCGRALLTSTIEDLDNKTDDAKRLWQASDPKVRDANGRTQSGLYRFFLPAYETTYFDKYGLPLIDKAKEFYLNQRAGLVNDSRALSSVIRKAAFSIEEAFRIDGDTCLYDAMKLNEQLDYVSWRDGLTERGSFVWKNGERFTEVEWKKDRAGRFEICWLFDKPGESNKVIKQGDKYYPKNNYQFACGCDPFKFNKVADSRRSDCAAFIYKKFGVDNDPYNEAFVCKYKFRAATTAIQYEDIVKMCWYYGCQVLFERNVDNWREWFQSNHLEGFLAKLPFEDDYGLYCDGHGKVIQLLCDYTESYIEDNIKKVFYKDLIQDWLEFKVENTTAYDCAMAAGYTLVAAKNKKFRQGSQDTSRDASNYGFKLRQAI